MTITADQTVTKTENFVETEVDGEVVLMDIQNGKFFSLETTGRRVWELLDENGSIGKLVDVLTREYDVPSDQCHSEVAALIADFHERKMVEVSAGQAA